MKLNDYEMTDHPKLKIFLVDDDALFLKNEELELNINNEFAIETFATGELCMQHLSKNPDVIIIDYWLNGINTEAMTGEQTLEKIKRYNSNIPVVIHSGQEEIKLAVNCMHQRAFDYVVKSKTGIGQLRKILNTIQQIIIL